MIVKIRQLLFIIFFSMICSKRDQVNRRINSIKLEAT